MTGTAVSASPTGGLVHGMGKVLVRPDWVALSDEEVRAVLRRYEGHDGAAGSREAVVTWQSPRPMSAAGLVQAGGRSVFVKRHHVAVRTADQLRVEHCFTNYLRSRGQLVPAVLRSVSGATVVRDGDFVYEVLEQAVGVDRYRDAPSWSPFISLGHARAAGRALARFHQAAADFPLPPRAPGVLMNSAVIVAAADPLAELGRLLAARPGLSGALARRSLTEDFAHYLLPTIEKAAPLLRALTPQWGHGDWHPSNLTWSSTSPSAVVAGVLDLGLANRTFAVHDLAVALERSTIDWLDMTETGHVAADLDAVDALVDGYEDVRPLDELESTALAAVLPVVHLEYALSEVEYFAEVVGSDVNADLACDAYLVGHARWFEGAAGSVLREHLCRRARRR